MKAQFVVSNVALIRLIAGGVEKEFTVLFRMPLLLSSTAFCWPWLSEEGTRLVLSREGFQLTSRHWPASAMPLSVC